MIEFVVAVKENWVFLFLLLQSCSLPLFIHSVIFFILVRDVVETEQEPP